MRPYAAKKLYIVGIGSKQETKSKIRPATITIMEIKMKMVQSITTIIIGLILGIILMGTTSPTE